VQVFITQVYIKRRKVRYINLSQRYIISMMGILHLMKI